MNTLCTFRTPGEFHYRSQHFRADHSLATRRKTLPLLSDSTPSQLVTARAHCFGRFVCPRRRYDLFSPLDTTSSPSLNSPPSATPYTMSATPSTSAATSPSPAPAAEPTRPLADSVLRPSSPQYDLAFAPFLKTDHFFGLDPNRPVCQLWMQSGECYPYKQCPDRHPAKPSKPG